MISRRLLVVGCAVLSLAGFALWSDMAWSADLVVAAPAGPLARLAELAFSQPFAQTAHVPVVVAPLGVGESAPPVPADLVLVDGQTLLSGCKSGAFRKLDWAAIGSRDRLLPQAATDCGMGAVMRGLVLAWSRDKFSGAPNWSDFWDVAKVPGKRGLRRGARGNLEFALIADGVAPSDVYGTLRGDAGVERAFRKLDQLKPYIVWWKTEEEAPRLLASGEVLMTSAPAEGVLAATKGTSGVTPRDFAVQWSAALLSFESWAVLSNIGAIEAADKFLAFASDLKQQKMLAGFAGYGSAVSGGTDDLGAAQKAESPSTPANLSSGLMVDESFWRDNGDKLDKTYEAWLTKP